MSELRVLTARRTMGGRFLARLMRRRMAMIGLTGVLMFASAAIIGPAIVDYSPTELDYDAVLAVPGGNHFLGTDEIGRDLLSRIVHGARVSLVAGVLATLVAFSIAIPLGIIGGYYGGLADSLIGRITDAMLAFPYVLVAILVTAVLGPSLITASFAIGISQIPKLVRVTRSEVLGVSQSEFVSAARAVGTSDTSIMMFHILPNISSTIVVQATILIPFAILAEAILSFLGLGVQPPAPSWGVMLAAAQPFMSQAPWLSVFPGLSIFLAALSFNVLGDGLRDVLDPRMRAL